MSGCHGSDGGGCTVGPPIKSGHWQWSDGSLLGLTATIQNGVARPKQYQGVMPPLGGAPLWPRDVAAVAAYVWAVGHAGMP
jgi:mono/diheme cytochrome c family protein